MDGSGVPVLGRAAPRHDAGGRRRPAIWGWSRWPNGARRPCESVPRWRSGCARVRPGRRCSRWRAGAAAARRAWDPAAEVRAEPGPGAAGGGGRRAGVHFPVRRDTRSCCGRPGAEVVAFDPLHDERAAARHRGPRPRRRLPGGARRRSWPPTSPCAGGRGVAPGMPVVAECAGLLYLARELDGKPMTGVLRRPRGRMTSGSPWATGGDRRRRPRLPGRATRARGHEFHRPNCCRASGQVPAWGTGCGPSGAPEGFVQGRRCTPPILHVHWAAAPAEAAKVRGTLRDAVGSGKAAGAAERRTRHEPARRRPGRAETPPRHRRRGHLRRRDGRKRCWGWCGVC